MTAAGTTPQWQVLSEQVPRTAFLPDTIWIRGESGSFTAVHRDTDPDAWHAAAVADAPVITQVDLGAVEPGATGSFPSSSCSRPGIVADMLLALDTQPGDRVLEIGTGTGWNAALLAHRVGPGGHVTTIEVDPALADGARRALTAAGYAPTVVTGDGTAGVPDHAPYDRVIATAAIREVVPPAWPAQLRPGGRLVTPWGTDWSNGVMLTVDLDDTGVGTGRFSGDLAFMRIRDQRRALHYFEPSPDAVAAADVSTTACRGSDLDRILDPDKGLFAIGARLAPVNKAMKWDRHGRRHHSLELDDPVTGSWARLDANLTDPAPFTVHQLGPRRLWDETEDAYDWWHDHGEPGLDRFGLTTTPSGAIAQTMWLDEPSSVVRTWASPG
ncbi:methyltransferase domain-containing protein [Pseudonocardia sp. HH130630-07]|uniref:methyltransferase domain-containing protein n=1 Tax=Pseudonocardia sp. HH130630-07 TaxID=1690815 RepID=UPI000814F006|nr:methyltransferase domain-containing protein [Pseudonocardia sp. HH130630-07]ANY05578.1 hypothetical protein AFB00_03820 [Pseudonocardia sp. HH130630-07]